ncbi:hypothetical protein Thiowin_03986 [Thiorhodovibrio winogradskyi]|uniref:Antitoxin n=1 Tax=Thiorhodovibrio winogradskyi TaxID=77007 RepID=A0ABZ0SGZ1_9GAMM|nr:antitoxin [Thiorhodovibrio winogradskyi]
MIETQLSLPDDLYREAQRIASEREWPLPEVLRRGVEYIVSMYPPSDRPMSAWTPPKPRALGRFQKPAEDWRLLANDIDGHEK